jgi:putative ABC transport system ATP-binding protein
MSATPPVVVESLDHHYGKGALRRQILFDVSATIPSGEIIIVTGPSGSGKTTLLNLIAAIDRPDSGRLVVAGRELSTLSAGELASWRSEHVGYVFQQANLVPVLSAYENVELPLGLLRLSRDERHRRVSLALEAVGLSDRAHHLPKQLSGGQEQRVAIARAIVADPRIVVADEPTGNLDHESADAVLNLVLRLNRERGKTIVMVTHDPRAAAFGTRRMHLDKGALRAEAA